MATRRPYDELVRKVMANMGVAATIIYNKDAVMIMPPGVHKGTGLDAALVGLSLFRKDTVGIGDAENDVEFLIGCGLSAAVANAIPSVKKMADFVARLPNGAGVREIVERFFALGAFF
jgi:hydroxymethylpyrimidine pyrophosphatase-like HAD family hydrolase